MASLSVTELWSEALALTRRHLPEAGPVVGAFILFPQVVQGVFMERGMADASPVTLVAQLAVVVLALFGQIAATIIMTGRSHDVADALRGARQAFPRILAVYAMFLGIIMAVMLVGLIGLIAVGAGPDMATGQFDRSKFGIAGSVIAALTMVVVVYVAVRLMALLPVTLLDGRGLPASLSSTWRLTEGATGTLLLFVLGYGMMALFLMGVTALVVGAVVGLVLGAKSTLGILITATLVATVSAGVSLISVAAAVAVYRKLSQ